MDEQTLDRQIAERLGWHSFHTRTDWYEHPEVGPYEQERLMGIAPSGDEREVPNWQGDMNAAIELVKLMPLGAVGIDDDGETWFCNAFMDGFGVLVDESAETPAMAICKAWLKYTLPQHTAADHDAGEA